MTNSTDRTRYLNDLTRTQPQIPNATWVLTQGVLHLLTDDAPDDQQAIAERTRMLRHAIATFDAWSSGDDPYGEHDFGTFVLFGQRLFFKIDYYHPDHDTHAPNPASVELCRRVLTIMLAEEY
jgi:Protein of unknown function (DUF3768)